MTKLVASDIVGIALIVSNLLLLPIIFISSVILYQNRRSMHFQKRGLPFLTVHLIIIFINNIIASPLNVACIYCTNILSSSICNDCLDLQPLLQYIVYIFTLALLLNVIFRLIYQFIQIHRSKHTQILITVQETVGNSHGLPRQESATHSTTVTTTNISTISR